MFSLLGSALSGLPLLQRLRLIYRYVGIDFSEPRPGNMQPVLAALPAGLRVFALHFLLLPRRLDERFFANPARFALAELWEGAVRALDLAAIDELLSSGGERFPCLEEVTVAVNLQIPVAARARAPEEFDLPILTKLRECRYFRFVQTVNEDLDGKSLVVDVFN